MSILSPETLGMERVKQINMFQLKKRKTQTLGVNFSETVTHFSFICRNTGDVWEMSKDKESRLKTKLIRSQMVAFSLPGNLINGQSRTRANLN